MDQRSVNSALRQAKRDLTAEPVVVRMNDHGTITIRPGRALRAFLGGLDLDATLDDLGVPEATARRLAEHGRPSNKDDIGRTIVQACQRALARLDAEAEEKTT